MQRLAHGDAHWRGAHRALSRQAWAPREGRARIKVYGGAGGAGENKVGPIFVIQTRLQVALAPRALAEENLWAVCDILIT